MKSHFFAYLSRMKNIIRWGLMRNTYYENIQEHSLQVAMIAHALALIENKYYGGDYDTDKIMSLAVYHDAGEIITGDLPTPIKYFNPNIKKEYNIIESIANKKLLNMLPEDFIDDYRELIEQADDKNHKIIKAADKLSAYFKCIEEQKAGNKEFEKARTATKRIVHDTKLKSVKYFMDTFAESFGLTIDELN